MSDVKIDFHDEAEVERFFALALDKLRAEFEGNHVSAANTLWPLIGDDVVRKMFKGGQQKYDNMTKQRLVWYYNDGPEIFLYRTLSILIGQNKYTKKIISSQSAGKYKYFRFYAKSNDPKKLTYISGDIEIFEKDGIPRFNHRSGNYRGDKPEHAGFVFQGGEHLFLLGMRKGVLRLAIAELAPSNRHMVGLVLSLRSVRPNDPFAGRFVMVREEETALIDELSSDRRAKKNSKWSDGEKKFFNLTQGGYAYFMLSLHDERQEDAD